MNRLVKSQKETKKVIENHKQYDLPHFLTELRECLGISRRRMADEINVPYMKIFQLEEGFFKKSIDCNLVSTLADYFGVDLKILIHKSNEWAISKKCCGIEKQANHEDCD